MKISECSYCGMLAITENDVCTSCRSLIPPEMLPDQTRLQPETSDFQPNEQVVATAGYPAPNAEIAAQQAPPDYRPFPGSSGAPQPLLESKCVKCETPLPRGQHQCLDCKNKKPSPVKALAFLAVIAVLVGFFSFFFFYEKFSPHAMFSKYAKTTGADEAIIFENFVLEGDTYVSVTAGSGYDPKTALEGPNMLDVFKFKMIFKKPNISSVEFVRDAESGSYTAFKQVFDGTSGWKYTNMPGQPAGYQDSEDAFGSKRFGMGLDEFDSLEFMDEASEQVYGKDRIKWIMNIKEIEVADVKKPSVEKVFIVGKQKHNGKVESYLLVFDQRTGLMIAMLKNDLMGTTPITTTIYFNNYAKFPVKRKGWFGVEETRILVPTKMSIVTRALESGQITGMPTVQIELNVKSLETDAPIEPGYFQKS